jgi:hypothetical protein
MQLWKMDSLGISSEDFINRDSQNAPNAFYGSLWRFKHDRTGTQIDPKQQPTGKNEGPQPSTSEQLTPQGFLKQAAQTEVADHQRRRQRPLDNHLVDEARRLGEPISEADTGYTEAHNEAQEHGNNVQAANHAIVHNDAKFTEASLMGMSKDQLGDIAAAVGVVNVELPKKKLVEAILVKQG